MLKFRVLFGTIMIILFLAVVIIDGWLDGSLTETTADDREIQATITSILITVIVIISQFEFSNLAGTKKLKIFTPVTILFTIIFANSWYLVQFIKIHPLLYFCYLSAFAFFALITYQYFRHGTSAAITNCGASFFSIIYLGILSSFILGIRIDFGLWELLMLIFVVKAADIGAYTFGNLYGKHAFSPDISPSKTWEGMAGAWIFAIIAALGFVLIFDIISVIAAVIFGFCFGFIGQLGDLAESIIKRDVEQKDSADSIPGFGGILDVIDSPLIAGAWGYLFFMYYSG